MVSIEGVIPALVTPKDDAGAVTTAPVPKLIRLVLERDVSGVFVGGSTGEGFCQTVEERKSFAGSVVSEVGRFPS